MKKLLVTAFALITVTFLTGCMSLGAAMGTSTKNKAEYQSAPGTPEDSVVFFGSFTNNHVQGFSQMNPDFPADYQEMENQIFISKPVAPGSTYAMARNGGSKTVYAGQYRYIYTWDHYLPLQTALAPLVINVPKKPGLYYVGSFWGSNIAAGSKFEPMEKSDKYEEGCLKGALKLYKGTAWEDAINKRLEEIKNAK